MRTCYDCGHDMSGSFALGDGDGAVFVRPGDDHWCIGHLSAEATKDGGISVLRADGNIL